MPERVPSTYKDLRAFVAYLDKRGQLRRIKAPVSCDLEITEITDRVSKSRDANYALLFENVRGHGMPVLINAMGSRERMAWALGLRDLEELRERMSSLVKPEVPAGLLEKVQKLGELSEVLRYRPKTVSSAPCQEILLSGAQADLNQLPILKCWPEDGGRYITLPLVISRDPARGTRNVGMYRIQVYDRNTCGMHWQIHKGGTEHQRRALETGQQRMEVAVALGGSPACVYAGSAPLPPGIDEIMFAGWLGRERVEMVKCKTIDLEVPAQAEIVLEGWVDPAEKRLEGPFGDHTGYYSLPDMYPVFHVQAITMRRTPIYPTTIVGMPPQEDYWLGKATERLFLPLMQLVVPEIVDVNMPAEGVFHNLVVVSIRKRFPGQARKVMYALWGLMLLSLSKYIWVVDEDVDVQDMREVLFHVTSNTDPRRDTVIVEGPLDALDHAADKFAYGGKMGLDATRKRPDLDHFPHDWPNDIRMAPEVVGMVTRRWREYGIS
ncbi:MAG: menaquinone biosynthesis decarboxylase [Roseiflexaceae bacterium]